MKKHRPLNRRVHQHACEPLGCGNEGGGTLVPQTVSHLHDVVRVRVRGRGRGRVRVGVRVRVRVRARVRVRPNPNPNGGDTSGFG